MPDYAEGETFAEVTMKGECFHYTDYIRHRVGDKTAFPGGISQPSEHYRDVDSSSLTLARIPGIVDRFGSISRCPYCDAELQQNRIEEPCHSVAMSTYSGAAIGLRCVACNWWCIQRDATEDNDGSDILSHHLSTYEAVICRFEEAIWSNALKCAEDELVEYRKGLKSLEPKAVEKVVGRILSQYHRCEVNHVGRSHDKGIDLIVVKGDVDIAVQVKHRYLSDKVQGVKPVREFVGAIVGEGFSTGLFVSTAPSFSKDASDYVARVNRNFVPLNLIDIRGLREIIGNISQAQWEVYEQVWNAILE